MKTIHFLYAVICIFLVIILLLFTSTPPAFVTGQPHPKFATMLTGGDSLSSQSYTKLLGFLFGLCTAVSLCVFLVFGAIKKNSLKGIRPWLLMSSLVYCLAFTLTYFSDVKYVQTGHTDFFFGWPLPTAWMIYVMWFAPICFVLIYILSFRKWILTFEDEERFQELVAQRNMKEN